MFIKEIVKKITPQPILKFIGLKPIELIFKIYNNQVNISYSQQGEDIELLNYFGRSFNGTFIDVGAHHPSIYSNTKILYDIGWKGINIEPNVDNFKLFTKERKRDINLNMAIGKQTGLHTYYCFNHSAVNSFDKEHVKHWESQRGFKVVKEVDIKIEPLVNILNQYLNKINPNNQIDLLSIDVEGMDLEVLESNDWEKYMPNAILVEDAKILTYKTYSESKIIIFLKDRGYRLERINGISLFFIRNRVDTE